MVNVVLWYYTSHNMYQKGVYLQPGEEYTIDGRTYTLPNLKLIGNAMVLKEEYLINQRKLLQNVTSVLAEEDIEHWISGGTLIGFYNFKTFICWDDDIDIHTHWENREYLYSDRFNLLLSQYGMETVFIKGNNMTHALTIGAAVRIRFKGTDTPICDIFFVKENEHGLICKVDSWTNTNDTVFNLKERWNKDDMFPIQTVRVDGMDLPMVANQEAVLIQQYGENVLKEMYARSTWFSHQYPFKVFNWIFKSKGN